MRAEKPVGFGDLPLTLRRVLFGALVLLGLGGLVAIPLLVGVEATWDAFLATGPVCIAAFVLAASLVHIIPAVSWWMLLRGEGLRVPVLECVRTAIMGFPLSFLTPSAYLGGEPVKVVYLAKRFALPAEKLVATIIVSKFQEFVGHILFMFVALGSLFLTSDALEGQEGWIAGLLALALGIIVVFLWSYARGARPLSRLLGWIPLLRLGRGDENGRRWRGIRKAAAWKAKLAALEESIHSSIARQWKVFFAAQFVCFFSALSVLARPLVFFGFESGLGLPVSFQAAFAVFLATNLTNLFQITPGGAAQFEGTAVGIFSAAGLREEFGLVYAILCRIADLLFLMAGIWCLAHAGMARLLRRRPAVPEPAPLGGS